MRRRDFLTFSLAATIAPIAAQAQLGVPKVGVLVVGNPEPFWTVFRQKLSELGYLEGQNILLELRSAEKADLMPVLAEELVRLPVKLIVAFQTPAVQAAKEATRDIPIVMSAGDPVGTGLVASLSRPGGNITGLSGATAELGGKMLELVREMLPK